MFCPNCKNVQLVMSERKGVEIDYCPECRGVWLDRGELDKVIEKSLAEEQKTPSPNQQHQSHGQHEHHQKSYRKKSFLMDLFD